MVTSAQMTASAAEGARGPAPPALEVRGLAKDYGGRLLFAGLDLHCGAGACLAVTGPNGSGKSTLLRILAGLVLPSRGQVRFHLSGDQLGPVAVRPHLGMIAPDQALYEELTAEENLRFFGTMRGREFARRELAECLSAAGLAGRGGDLVQAYSTGMRQRLRLACATVHDPVFLLMDEPGAHLDDAGRELVARAIATACQRGGVVVLATNDEREARLADQTLRLGS